MEPAEYTLMDDAEDRMWWYSALHARLGRILAGVQGPILDAGCGTGGLLARLGRSDSVGLEYDATAAGRAAVKSGCRIVRGSVNALPFRSGAFAAVSSADVLCHAAVDPAAALHELHRVLRPGGLLVLNLPAYQWLLSAHDRHVHNVRRFTAGSVKEMLKSAGFSQCNVRYWNGLLLPLMVLQRKVLAHHEAAASDVAPFSPWLDAIFRTVTTCERYLPMPLPAGGSVLATATRNGEPP
jgi:SAM-dependent methyltransferase